jgi:hypothetical protein
MSIVQLKARYRTVKDRLQKPRTSFAPETTRTNQTSMVEIERKPSKINEADRYPAAHNGLVAGSISFGFSFIDGRG